MYTAEDFKMMKFKVMSVPEGKEIYDEMPVFRKYPEFNETVLGGISRTKAIKFVALMYDIGSPLVRDIDDVSARQREAILYAGLYDSGHGRQTVSLPMHLKALMLYGNVKINAMIIRYMKMQASAEFKTLIAIQTNHQRNVELLFKRRENSLDNLDDAKRKLEIEKQLPEQIDRINTLKKKIAGNDNVILGMIADQEEGIAEMYALSVTENGNI